MPNANVLRSAAYGYSRLPLCVSSWGYFLAEPASACGTLRPVPEWQRESAYCLKPSAQPLRWFEYQKLLHTCPETARWLRIRARRARFLFRQAALYRG